MTLPAGVETRTVRLTMPLDTLGKPPRSYEGRVNVDRALVWEETGARLWPAGAELPNVAAGAILLPVPIVDQDGWLDGSGRPVTGWSYRVTVTALWGTGERQTVSRVFQVVEDTPDDVELELLPDGATEPVVLGPVGGDGGEALAAETAARIAADDTLTAGLAAETAARVTLGTAVGTLTTQVGDKADTSALTAETAARVAADTAESTARAAAVTAEATARAAADTALTTALGGKAATGHAHVVGDVTGLQAALDGKATAAQGALADTAVQPAELDARFDALVDDAPELLNTLGEITAQLALDESAVAALTTLIGTKASQAALDVETAARVAETAARVAADTALDGRLDVLEAADFATNAGLSDEVAARALADALLEDRIEAIEADYGTDAEVSAAIAAEAVLARNANNLSSGTVADARIAATIARDSEVTAAVAAEAVLARDGSNITGGTVAAARIDAAIARLASPALTGTPTAPTQGAGDNSTKIATTAYVATAVAAGGDGWTYERLGADWTNSTVTDSDIFAGFTPAANKAYEIEVKALVESAIQTTGIQVGLVGPTGQTTISQHVRTPGTATSVLDNHLSVFGRATAGTTVAAPSILTLSAFVRYGAGPGAGNVKLQGRSEVGGGSTVTMYTKSYMRWRELP